MARLFVPFAAQFSTVTDAGGTLRLQQVLLTGDLHLFGPDVSPIGVQVVLEPDEQAAMLAVVEAAVERHWLARSAAYAASLSDPDADEIIVPALGEASAP